MDTGLLMYELIDAGVDSPRGRQVIRMLNNMHRRWPIANDDYLYVLATFIVVPVRFADQYGARATTDVEKEAIAAFYRQVGQLMGIHDLPDGYRAAAEVLDRYEAANAAPSPAGAALLAATTHVAAARLPRPLRSHTAAIIALLLPDHICAALSLPIPTARARWALRQVMALRRWARHLRPGPPKPVFTAGVSGKTVYPAGYDLFTDLGVAAAPVNGPRPPEVRS